LETATTQTCHPRFAQFKIFLYQRTEADQFWWQIALMNESVIHRFEKSIREFPERVALWAQGRSYTYAELGSMAEAVRRTLVERGLGGAPRIGITTGTGGPTYAAILGILANGSAYVPINVKNPSSRNLAVVDEAEISALLYEAEDDLVRELAKTRSGSADLIAIEDAGKGGQDPLCINWPRAPDLAYLFFTSGSTGTPKGVPISHHNLNQFLSVVLDSGLYDFNKEDRFLQMFELTFDLSVMSLFVPLSVGACCYVVPESRFGAITALKVLQEHDVTVALMVPSILAFLEPHLGEKVKLPALRKSMFCGEALPDRLVQKWSKSVPNAMIENVYGPTEATIFCFRYFWCPSISPAAAVKGIVPIGAPLPGTGALLVDENLNLITEKGARGELLLTGGQLADGYWRQSEKTKAAFVDLDVNGTTVRAYRTGDLCSIDQDQNYVFHGRIDSQVKIDGHRVELGEVEHHVREILGRSNIAVIAPEEGNRRVLVLFLEAPEVDRDRLVVEMKSRIPDYMVPRRVEYVGAMPVNLNGKVDKSRLADFWARQ
jgi:D-alanine--poly(phosphoribitol) ligase subunit 1